MQSACYPSHHKTPRSTPATTMEHSDNAGLIRGEEGTEGTEGRPVVDR